MKRILSLILGVVLIFSLVGCGDENVDKNSFESAKEYVEDVKSEREQKEEKEKEQFENNKKSISEEVSISDYTLKLKEYSVVDSTILDGEKNIIITFDYTNTGEYDGQFGALVGGFGSQPALKLYQDGIELKGTASKLWENHSTVIKPGTTIEVIYPYQLENETSDIEVELKKYDREISTCTIKLK